MEIKTNPSPYVTVWRVLDRFHDKLYDKMKIPPQYIYSDSHAFGADNFEQLSNFMNWCKVHGVSIADLEEVELSKHEDL